MINQTVPKPNNPAAPALAAAGMPVPAGTAVADERCAWHARLKEGKADEYIRRHNELFWPEMTELFNQAGIRNYTIWLSGNELFGYYECERGAAFASAAKTQSPVFARWSLYMRDLMETIDPDGSTALPMRQVFRHP